MLELLKVLIVFVLFVVEMAFLLSFIGYVFSNIDYYDSSIVIFKTLTELLADLFYDRNLFGKILSCLVFVILMPSIIIVLLCQCVISIVVFFVWILTWIWDLGDKKED